MVIATQQHADGSEIDARIVERGREKGTRIEAQVELLPSFFSNFQLRKKRKRKRKKIEKKGGVTVYCSLPRLWPPLTPPLLPPAAPPDVLILPPEAAETMVMGAPCCWSGCCCWLIMARMRR